MMRARIFTSVWTRRTTGSTNRVVVSRCVDHKKITTVLGKRTQSVVVNKTKEDRARMLTMGVVFPREWRIVPEQRCVCVGALRGFRMKTTVAQKQQSCYCCNSILNRNRNCCRHTSLISGPRKDDDNTAALRSINR